MISEHHLFDKKISGPLTIPSGIVATEVSVLEKIAKEIPEIGILTTKSIGLEAKAGNKEPIIAQYAPFSFINAVGLTNPGVEEFKRRVSKLKIPENKFLLISIFGKNEEEFGEIAKKLTDFADGFELNISCPHSDRYGQIIGQDKELVERVTKKVASLGRPVFIKISPNLNVKETVKSVLQNGAAGITAINTKGPELYLYDSQPVLSNKVGGISGKAILELGLDCVKEIRKITNVPIIACGGISSAEDIKNYKEAGADFFGIGSALAGIKTEEIKRYFQEILKDLTNGTNKAADFLKDKLNMEYQKYKVKRKEPLAENLFLIQLDRSIKINPGQFIFTWLPEKGEKPFSVLDDEPLTLLIQKRGCFTDELSKLNEGDPLYIRGPYGNSPEINEKTLLVGGGTGMAGLYLFAKKNKKTAALLGARNKNYLPYLEKFKTACENLYLFTENGELGRKGLVTDGLEEIIKKSGPEYVVNCGPEPMVKKAIQIETKFLNPKKIYSSIEFLTKCGIGLCGSCATAKGYRSCVDGTFLKPNQI